MGEDGHAQVDQLWSAVGGGALEAVQLGVGDIEADLEPFPLVMPAIARASRTFWMISIGRPRWRGSILRTGQRMQASLNCRRQRVSGCRKPSGVSMDGPHSLCVRD